MINEELEKLLDNMKDEQTIELMDSDNTPCTIVRNGNNYTLIVDGDYIPVQKGDLVQGGMTIVQSNGVEIPQSKVDVEPYKPQPTPQEQAAAAEQARGTLEPIWKEGDVEVKKYQGR